MLIETGVGVGAGAGVGISASVDTSSGIGTQPVASASHRVTHSRRSASSYSARVVLAAASVHGNALLDLAIAQSR
jgi:hypothetical protein